MEKTKRLALEEEILEFCNEPRSLDEIREFVGVDSTKDAVRRHFVNPLVRDGKIKSTHSYRAYCRQRYINANVDVTQSMLDDIVKNANKLKEKQCKRILDFCKVPRGTREIQKYLGTTTANAYVRDLLDSGKLKFTIPETPYSNQQKYINTEIEYKVLTEEDIVDFCNIPRTKHEIEEHFDMTQWCRKTMIKRLLEKNKICYTEDSLKLGLCDGNRRLVKIG